MKQHSREEKIEALGRVLDTLDILRVKCPWDAKQTNESLRANTIEETYELAQALLDDDNHNICKELGDVLLHIFFYAKIGQEKELFDIVDVAEALNNKLIFRHPHVFGTVEVSDSHEVEQNWEKLKLRERDGNRSVLAGVPAALPALVKAYRVQEKAANIGFDWDKPEDVWAKVAEERGEVDAAIAGGNHDEIEAEFGDLLFSVINAARKNGVNAENALERTNRKFISRFNSMEQLAAAEGHKLSELSLAEMDSLWNRVKTQDKKEIE